MLTAPREFATKTVYAAIGAPVVATRAMKEYRTKVADYSGKLVDKAEKRFDSFAGEGEKVAKRLQDRQVVEEIQSRVDLEKVQDRVEKLRDQLEGALQSWRESFSPAEHKTPATKVPVESQTAAKPAAKKTTTRKPAARKSTAKTPAAKKTTARKTTAAKKTAAAKPAAKATATK